MYDATIECATRCLMPFTFVFLRDVVTSSVQRKFVFTSPVSYQKAMRSILQTCIKYFIMKHCELQ
jgi:hypothetical protein